MEAIATLANDDPYLTLPREERIAARKQRRAKFRKANPPEKHRTAPLVDAAAPRPEFSFSDWVQRQNKLNPLPKEPWFSIEAEIDAVAKVIRIEDIQRAVRKFYNLTKTELIADRRTAHLVRARQIAMYLAKKITLRSLPEIGRRFGGRDHTTVLHSVKKIEHLIAVDVDLATDVETIRERLAVAS